MNISELKKVNKQELGITEGRIVHFHVEASPGIVVCRPAIIVNAWREASYEHGEVNLTVFSDWTNDAPALSGAPMEWKTSVPMHTADEPGDRRPNTWHFPER